MLHKATRLEWIGRRPAAAGLALVAVLVSLATAADVRPASAEPSLTLDTATLTSSWKESWLTGNVAYGGTVGEASELNIFLRRTSPTPTVVAARKTQSVAAGGYSGTLELPHRALPGTYVLRVVGTSGGIALPAVESTLTLPAPPEGVVDKSVVSRTPGGKSIRKVKGPVKELFARFHFIVPPDIRAVVRLLWRTPQFNFVGEVRKPYATTLDTFIRSGSPLPKGTWYCLLQVNEIVVKRVAVRIT